jgi:hypothetical protein
MVSVVFVYESPDAPNPPGGRTQEGIAPDLVFHDAACRDAWCEKAGIAAPTAP